jgi:cysteine desulfuration protein SufE
MTLTEHQQRLLNELAARRDPRERLAWLITRTPANQPLPAEARTDATRVPGCLAQLWLVGAARGGVCEFRCDSDSRTVRAVAGLLCEYFSGCEPAAVAAAELTPLVRAGLDRLLTANRRNALARVVGRIQSLAADLATARASSG